MQEPLHVRTLEVRRNAWQDAHRRRRAGTGPCGRRGGAQGAAPGADGKQNFLRHRRRDARLLGFLPGGGRVGQDSGDGLGRGHRVRAPGY